MGTKSITIDIDISTADNSTVTEYEAWRELTLV